MAPLVARFDFAHFGRAPARFDDAELAMLNQKIVHMLPYAAVAGRLPEGITAAAWPVIQPNLATVDEAADYVGVLAGEIAAPALSEEDRVYLGAAATALKAMAWGDDPWQCADDRAQGRHWPQGPRLVPAAAPRAHRTDSRPRHGGAAAAHRPRPGAGPGCALLPAPQPQPETRLKSIIAGRSGRRAPLAHAPRAIPLYVITRRDIISSLKQEGEMP